MCLGVRTASETNKALCRHMQWRGLSSLMGCLAVTGMVLPQQMLEAHDHWRPASQDRPDQDMHDILLVDHLLKKHASRAVARLDIKLQFKGSEQDAANMHIRNSVAAQRCNLAWSCLPKAHLRGCGYCRGWIHLFHLHACQLAGSLHS